MRSHDDDAAAAVMGSAPPVIKLITDPETQQRVAMAAESDLEASRYAHWRGTVTFHDVANAWFNMSDPNLSDELRAEFKAIFPGLLDAFAEPRKGIITAYFCRHIRVAAALTDIGHAAGAPEGVPEAELKGPPPAAIVPLLAQRDQDVAAHTNGHGEPRSPRFRRHRAKSDDDGRGSSTCSTRRRRPAPRSTSSRRSATPRTGRPRSCCSSACICTTARSSS